MTGNLRKAAASYEVFDAARRAAQVEHEERHRLREPEVGVRAKSAPVPERDLWGEPTSRHNGDASPVLGLPYVAMFWTRPGGQTVSVRQFRVPIHGYDD